MAEMDARDQEVVATPDLVGQLTPYLGVYLWEGTGTPPARLRYLGKDLERFMDRIYVPGDLETLTPNQIAIVNSLRRSLMLKDEIEHANSVVKARFASVLSSLPAGRVLEWGCGYSSMAEHLDQPGSLTCVDIDDDVVGWQQARDQACFQADGTIPELGIYDAVISVFVFHFHISPAHIRTMAAALTPTGLLLANVYRRDEASRSALVEAFREAGLRVERMPDPENLCARHEYWVMSNGLSSLQLHGILEMLLQNTR